MDGAYQSRENLLYGQTHSFNLIFTGISRAKGRYEYTQTDQGLVVYDRHTRETINATEYKTGRYKIKQPNGRWRYINSAEIECYGRRRTIEQLK